MNSHSVAGMRESLGATPDRIEVLTRPAVEASNAADGVVIVEVQQRDQLC